MVVCARGSGGPGVGADRYRTCRFSRGAAKPPPVGPTEKVAVTVGPNYRHYCETLVTRWSGEKSPYDQRFVNLTLLQDQGEEAQGPRWQSGRQFENLETVLGQIPDPAIVVLGPPGSGKSTLLRHLALDRANATLENTSELNPWPLTFFLPLNSYKAKRTGETVPLPKEWLAERWQNMSGGLEPLDALLRKGRMTFLLDALNEMPVTQSEAIPLWHDFLAELAADYPGNRVIFTCRYLAYSASLSSKELPIPQVRIESLSDTQVQKFLDVYRPEHSTNLWQKLKDSPQLEVLRSPYFLDLLVKQTQGGKSPQAARPSLPVLYVKS